MAPKIFLTGATGYIGGSLLHALYTKHPDWDYTLLLRSDPPPASFQQAYPTAKIIPGTYDDLDTLRAAASAADVVVHNGNSDHAASLRALLEGLKTPAAATTSPRAAAKHLIHLSGTGIFSDFDDPAVPPGAASPHTHSDDASDALAVLDANPHALHAETERLLREAWEAEERVAAGAGGGDAGGVEVRTAVVRPPDIYGRGIGLGRKSSFWVPWYVREVVGTEDGGGVGAAFFVGEGANRRGWAHIEDVVEAYARVVERAVEGKEGGWGREGYYHTTTQEYSQLEVARAVGRILYEKGLIKEKEPKQLPVERVDGMLAAFGHPRIARYLFAANSRVFGRRSQELLGWEPKAPSLLDTLEQDIDDTIEAMGDKAYFRVAH